VPQGELLAQLADPDEDRARRALETLYVAFFERLWKFAYLTVHERGVAEEVTQDVFFTLWQRRNTIDVQGDIAVYLHTAVRYRAAKHVRHDRVVARHAELAERQRDDEWFRTHAARPDDEVVAGEIERLFLDRLASVPDRPRQALVLRWRDGWTYEDIGQVLGISKVAARALILRYQRALQPFLDRLRQELHG